MARDARFIAQYEELAVRLRGVSEDEAKQAVERLLRETNQQVTAAEVALFTLGSSTPSGLRRILSGPSVSGSSWRKSAAGNHRSDVLICRDERGRADVRMFEEG
jgi:hypothetical protein